MGRGWQGARPVGIPSPPFRKGSGGKADITKFTPSQKKAAKVNLSDNPRKKLVEGQNFAKKKMEAAKKTGNKKVEAHWRALYNSHTNALKLKAEAGKRMLKIDKRTAARGPNDVTKFTPKQHKEAIFNLSGNPIRDLLEGKAHFTKKLEQAKKSGAPQKTIDHYRISLSHYTKAIDMSKKEARRRTTIGGKKK